MRRPSNRRHPTPAVLVRSGGFLLQAIGIAIAGFAGETFAGASDGRIEALCRARTESPCIVNVSGTLHSARTGGPLVGRRLRFVAEGEVICVSVTDRHGRASCSGVAPSGRSIAESGYRIVFDGEGKYVSGSARSHPRVRSDPDRSL